MLAKNVILPLTFLVVGAAIGFLARPPLATISPAVPSPTPSSSPSVEPTTAPKAGWKIYKNAQYGFEFSYPETYKVLTDKENLYGWPKAILLLYKGGQSYDLAIEVWDSAKPNYDLSVKTKDGQFITLKNLNNDPEVADIIATFKLAD